MSKNAGDTCWPINVGYRNDQLRVAEFLLRR